MASEGKRHSGCTGMIVDRVLIPGSIVIPGSSGPLQMVDHTLIDVPLANVYLDSLYYKGHCKVMCVSSPVYPVIIGNARGARQMLPDPDWKAEDRGEAQARTSEGNNDDTDNQGGDMPNWMFKEESNRGKEASEILPRISRLIQRPHPSLHRCPTSSRKERTEQIQWNEAQEHAYSLLKEYLLPEPVLKLPDLMKLFVLRTDASGVGVAIVLLQENEEKFYPVGYASKTLGLADPLVPNHRARVPGGSMGY